MGLQTFLETGGYLPDDSLPLSETFERPATVDEIINAVSEVSGLSPTMLLGARRQRSVVLARWAIWQLTFERHEEASYPTMATWFRRNHTTIMNAIHKIPTLDNPWFDSFYEGAKEILDAQEDP